MDARTGALSEGRMKVYKLEHVHVLYDDVEDTKFLGIFSTKEKAEDAMKILSKQPGFKDFPKLIDDNDIEEGFYITEEVVDEISGWKEGFTTVKWRE